MEFISLFMEFYPHTEVNLDYSVAAEFGIDFPRGTRGLFY